MTNVSAARALGISFNDVTAYQDVQVQAAERALGLGHRDAPEHPGCRGRCRCSPRCPPRSAPPPRRRARRRRWRSHLRAATAARSSRPTRSRPRLAASPARARRPRSW